MGWARALRPCPVASCATRRGTTCGWFHQWRSAERLLLGLHLPQAVPRNLLLAEACRHGPAGVESAVSRSPYRSALGRHSLSEFLLACVSFPSDNGRPSSPHELRSRTIP